uniref:Uncharacterized protein n=1 Tax=Timema monikensis TaxID=170555 RepID=A0A7R9EIK4_9NEOP|nr:unnamed protein product [Timema monikensis]
MTTPSWPSPETNHPPQYATEHMSTLCADVIASVSPMAAVITSSCNRTYHGDVGKTYELELHRPREDRLPFICQLTLTAGGGDLGDIVQSQDSNLCLLLNNYRELSANHALARKFGQAVAQSLASLAKQSLSHSQVWPSSHLVAHKFGQAVAQSLASLAKQFAQSLFGQAVTQLLASLAKQSLSCSPVWRSSRSIARMHVCQSVRTHSMFSSKKRSSSVARTLQDVARCHRLCLFDLEEERNRNEGTGWEQGEEQGGEEQGARELSLSCPQLTFDSFTLGRFVSFTVDGCPDGWLQIIEMDRPLVGGSWCGTSWGSALYYSETRSITLNMRLNRLNRDQTGYNFDFRLGFKMLRREAAVVRYGGEISGEVGALFGRWELYHLFTLTSHVKETIYSSSAPIPEPLSHTSMEVYMLGPI